MIRLPIKVRTPRGQVEPFFRKAMAGWTARLTYESREFVGFGKNRKLAAGELQARLDEAYPKQRKPGETD